MKEDKLYKLIRSLRGSEKRYFSIWCTRHYGKEKNIALQLFTDLQKLKVYDQKEFLIDHKNNSYTKNFRFNKYFLFNQLLRCLHSFHSGRNTEAKLKEMQDHADILSEKGLMDESLATLENAAKLALKYECFGIYYELKRKELELMRDINYRGIGKDKIKNIVNEIRSALSKASVLAETEAGVMQLLQSLTEAGLPRGEVNSQAKELTKRLKENAGSRDLFRSNVLYAQGMGTLEFSKGNFESAINWTEKVLEIFERFPHMKEERKKSYVIAVQNHLIISNYLNKFEGLDDLLNALLKIKADTPQMRNRMFYITHNMRLGTQVHVGDFENAVELVKIISLKHKKKEVEFPNPQQEVIFKFSSALACFGAEKYKEANKWVNQVIDSANEQLREDLQSFARIFNIIIQFESGKEELLEYSVRSAYRFLAKKKKLYKVEKVIMDFLRKTAPILNSKQKQLEAFQRLHSKLLPLSKIKTEKQAFQFFDFLAWLESKISNKHLGEILKKKYPEYWNRNV